MPDVSVHGPYEDVAIELLKTIQLVLASQPPDVRQKLWQLYLEDLEKWRSFWERIANLLNLTQKGEKPSA